MYIVRVYIISVYIVCVYIVCVYIAITESLEAWYTGVVFFFVQPSGLKKKKKPTQQC